MRNILPKLVHLLLVVAGVIYGRMHRQVTSLKRVSLQIIKLPHRPAYQSSPPARVSHDMAEVFYSRREMVILRSVAKASHTYTLRVSASKGARPARAAKRRRRPVIAKEQTLTRKPVNVGRLNAGNTITAKEPANIVPG